MAISSQNNSLSTKNKKQKKQKKNWKPQLETFFCTNYKLYIASNLSGGCTKPCKPH